MGLLTNGKPVDSGLLSAAKTWWKSQYQDGGKDNMWVDWDKLAPEDQASIAGWYQQNRLDPFMSKAHGIGSSESRGFAPGAETSDSAKAFDSHLVAVRSGFGDNETTTYRERTPEEYAALLRGVDQSAITGEGRVLGMAGMPVSNIASQFKDGQYDITQAGLLNRISPEIAAKYGITPEGAQQLDYQNWVAQNDRRNTHAINNARENAAIEAVLLAIGTAGLGSAYGALASEAGLTGTTASVASGAATGATVGAASAQMNDQDVGKGASKGALVGGIAGGLGSTANQGSSASNGIYNTGYTTGSNLGDSMVQGAVRGGVSAGMQGGNIGRGALAGAASSGAGQYINSNNTFGSDWANRAASSMATNAINSYANGRPVSWQGLLSSGAAGAASGLTDNKLVNQAAGGLLNYALSDRSQNGRNRFIQGADSASYADSVAAKRAAAKKAYYAKMKGNGNG